MHSVVTPFVITLLWTQQTQM